MDSEKDVKLNGEIKALERDITKYIATIESKRGEIKELRKIAKELLDEYRIKTYIREHKKHEQLTLIKGE